MLIWLSGSVQSSAEKPGVLNLFLSHFFFMLSSKRGVSNPAFQNSGSNPTWFWKPEKNPFQTWKRLFLVYFKRAAVSINAIFLFLTSTRTSRLIYHLIKCLLEYFMVSLWQRSSKITTYAMEKWANFHLVQLFFKFYIQPWMKISLHL